MSRQYHVLSGLIRDLRNARQDGAPVWQDWLDEVETTDEHLDDIEDVRPERDGSTDDLPDTSVDVSDGHGDDLSHDEVDERLPLEKPGVGSRGLRRLAATMGRSDQPAEGPGLPGPVARTGGASILRTRVTRG